MSAARRGKIKGVKIRKILNGHILIFLVVNETELTKLKNKILSFLLTTYLFK